MYKILTLIAPVDGHFNPFIPIIHKFADQGHQIACMTGVNYQKRVEKMGATFYPLPEKWDPKDQELMNMFPELKKLKGVSQIKFYLKHILLEQAPEVLEVLKKLLISFPADVVMSDSFMIAGGWMSELGGPPNVRLSVLPLALPDKSLPPYGLGMLPTKSSFSKLKIKLLHFFFEHIVFRDVTKYTDEIRQKTKLTPYGKNTLKKSFEIPNLILHASIPQFEFPVEKYPENLKFIGSIKTHPVEDYEKPQWWSMITESNQPVILINQGTISNNYRDLILPAIEGLKGEDAQVITVPVKEGEIEDMPENVHAEPYIPFGNLLPFVDIMVTNGGFGGTQNALAQGIPVIIAGATEDKMEVAARVEQTGAGINLRKQRPTPEDIKLAVQKVIDDPSYKKKAEQLREIYATFDAPTLAVELIKDLIEQQEESGRRFGLS